MSELDHRGPGGPNQVPRRVRKKLNAKGTANKKQKLRFVVWHPKSPSNGITAARGFLSFVKDGLVVYVKGNQRSVKFPDGTIVKCW